MIKVDLPEQIVSFISTTGHKYVDPTGKTFICNNPFWYNYEKGDNNESWWNILEPKDFPTDLKADYIEYLEDFLNKLKGINFTKYEESGIPEL